METIHVNQTIEKDGEVTVTGLPVRKGQHVEMTLLIQPVSAPLKSDARMTASELLTSGLIGIWKERTDIHESSTFARQLREQAQRRY